MPPVQYSPNIMKVPFGLYVEYAHHGYGKTTTQIADELLSYTAGFCKVISDFTPDEMRVLEDGYILYVDKNTSAKPEIYKGKFIPVQ